MKLFALFSASVAVFSTTFTPVDAHGWLVQPVSRETSARTDEAGTMGCPDNTPGKSTTFKPGEKITVRYPRNNHIGGFIRWAIVPRGQESKANFDNNVFYYTCRESGSTCLPSGTNEVYSGDNGAPADSILCGDTITLPDWLPAGDYVLQWTWLSAGSSYGNLEWANEQYRSCADIKFTTAGSGKKPSCPTFVGGDRVTKLQNKGSDRCFYFHDNKIVSSVFKGEKGKADEYYKFGKPADVETCRSGSATAPATSAKNETTSPVFPAYDDCGGDEDTDAAPTTSPVTSAPAPPKADDTDEDTDTGGNGTVKPASGLKKAWEYCTADSECENGCCSDQLSDDSTKKCTPKVCSLLKAGKKDQWEYCSTSDECANSCCSKRLSDDGKWKCTPGGAC